MIDDDCDHEDVVIDDKCDNYDGASGFLDDMEGTVISVKA